MGLIVDINGNTIIQSGAGETVSETLQNITSQTKFEDFKTTGWYLIPSSWYELINTTFNLAMASTLAHGGLLHVISNSTYIRYWFYPFGGNGKTHDAGLNSHSYGYSAYGYEQEIEGFYYPNNDTAIRWRKNLSTLTDSLQGKTILLVGDSIPASFKGLYGFATKHDCTVLNKCNGGTSIAYRTSDKSDSYDASCLVAITDSEITTSESSYYLDIENTDVLVLWMGTNDYGNSIPIGNVADIGNEFDDTTMIGALQHSVENIIARNPSINIIMCSPMYRYCNTPEKKSLFEKYVDGVISVANLYHIPCKNMYLDCGINDLNRGGFLDDAGLHPSSTQGYAMVRGKYENWIEQNV